MLIDASGIAYLILGIYCRALVPPGVLPSPTLVITSLGGITTRKMHARLNDNPVDPAAYYFYK